MSLDVYLIGPQTKVPCTCPDCGDKHETKRRETFFHANITHNLGQMASKAGIYKCLWRPEEIKVTKAKQLIPLLEKGIALMRSDPERF